MLMRDRYCLITGSTRGLGEELTRTFWESGASLLLIARNADDLERQRAAAGPRPGQKMLTLAVDLTQPDAAERIIGAARAGLPRVDVLINNAALQGPVGALWDNDWSAWLATLQVDLLAPVALCRAIAPWMMELAGGSIINLSGGGASSPRAHFSAYATAKSALVGFSQTLAEELRPYSISVNCVAPGAMSTAMLDEIIRGGARASSPKEYEQAVRIRKEGGASMQDVARLCLLLASADARAITGKLISAVWDPWSSLLDHASELTGSDVYTLRRILPKDRGLSWGSDR